jgi:hypothetical protein
MGLGWKVYTADGLRVIHHGGESAGHQSFLGFDRDRGVGVLLLADSRADEALDQVALYLLTGNVPLPDFSHPREILLAAEVLETYVGKYRIDGENFVGIDVRDGRLLYTETTTAGKLVRETTIYASSESDFYFTDIPVTLVFDRPDPETGKSAPGVTLLLSDDQTFRALPRPIATRSGSQRLAGRRPGFCSIRTLCRMGQPTSGLPERSCGAAAAG